MASEDAAPAVEIAFLDVGQGDTIVVSVPATREALVVDCIDASAVLDYLVERGIRHVRGLLITHLHADHYRNAVEFLQNCEPQILSRCEGLYYNWDWGRERAELAALLTDPDRHSDSAALDWADPRMMRVTAYRGLRDWAERHADECGGLALGVGGCPMPGRFRDVITVLHPRHADMAALMTRGGLNNTAAVLRVSGPGTRALLTSDIEGTAWEQLQVRGVDVHADVLQLPHHGGWDDLAQLRALLDAVDPSLVVTSVGTTGGRYGHPADAMFQAVRERDGLTRLMCTQATEKCGAVGRDQRQRVLTLLDADPSANGRPRFGSANGCPCAGTIVIELGDEVRVVRPSPLYHRDDIIGTLYPERHQCIRFARPGEPGVRAASESSNAHSS